jgi:hypothetical protein
VIPAPSAPFVATANNIAAAQTLAAAGYLNLVTLSRVGISVMTYNGIPNIIKLDCARNLAIQGAGGVTARTITVFGMDQYGIPMSEQIPGPAGDTSTWGNKAFQYISAIYVDGGTGANISIGTGNIFGFPYLISSQNYAGLPLADGIPQFPDVLGPNTLTAANGTSNIVVAVNNTFNIRVGQFIRIAGAVGFRGITADQLNISAKITAIVADTSFTYVCLGIATSSGTGGGPFIVASGIIPGQQINATPMTGDVRGTFTYTNLMNGANNTVPLVADGAKRFTINMYNASGDARNYNAAANGTYNLNADPIQVRNASSLVLVFAPNHQLTQGENVTIAGAADTGGIIAAQLNITAPVTIYDENHFIYTANGAGASNANGGGGVVTMTPGTGNLYKTSIGRFGVAQYALPLI